MTLTIFLTEKRSQSYFIMGKYLLEVIKCREGTRTILPYIPPHPARGTGVHRIVIVVGTIEKTLSFNQRKCTISEMLQITNGKILGFSFFRTFWTKHVTDIYGQLGNLRFLIIFLRRKKRACLRRNRSSVQRSGNKHSFPLRWID